MVFSLEARKSEPSPKEAAEAAIPPNLLAMLQMGAMRMRSKSSGKSGAIQSGSLRGRPAGTRRGEPGAGARLNVIDTLRSAAPWQRLRRQERIEKGIDSSVLVEVRRDDFRITRYRQRMEQHARLQRIESALAERKAIERAKGLIMQRKQCSEEVAYQALRRLAMSSNRKIADIANDVIRAAGRL